MQKAIQKSPNLNSKVHNRLPPTQHLSTQSQGVSSQSHCRFHVTFWNQPITGQRCTSHPLNQPITDQKNQQPITSDFTYIKINQSQISQMRYSTNHWSHIRYHSVKFNNITFSITIPNNPYITPKRETMFTLRRCIMKYMTFPSRDKKKKIAHHIGTCNNLRFTQMNQSQIFLQYFHYLLRFS